MLARLSFVIHWTNSPLSHGGRIVSGDQKSLCLAMEIMGMRLSLVKQSFFGSSGQYGRLVTRANYIIELRRCNFLSSLKLKKWDHQEKIGSSRNLTSYNNQQGTLPLSYSSSHESFRCRLLLDSLIVLSTLLSPPPHDVTEKRSNWITDNKKGGKKFKLKCNVNKTGM